jgi:hypothetical protein
MPLPTSPKVAETDLSARLLDTMFGTGWENVITGQSNSISSGMVFPILEGFNAVALTGVCILFVLVLSIGVAGTAHEGKALGKRYSTLWTPIRGALSVSMLAPVVKGMSLFQVALLAMVGWSINLANFAWETGVNAFVEQGGMLVASPPPQLQENASDLAKNILKNQVVQAYYLYWEDKPVAGSSIYQGDSTDNNEYIIRFAAPENTFDGVYMGKIVLPCPPGGIYNQRIDAIARLIGDLTPIAYAIADPEQTADPNALVRAVDTYGQSVMSAMTQTANAMNSLSAELDDFKAQAVSSGWATAGSYYFAIAKINDRRRNALQASAQSIALNNHVVSSFATEDFDRIMAGYDAYVRSSLLQNSASTISETAQVAEDSQVMGLLRKIFSYLFAEKIFSSIAQGITDNDPVATIVDYGHTLISGTVTGFVTYFAAAGTMGTAKGWSDSLVGQAAGVVTGGTKSAFLGALESVFKAAAPMIILLLIAFFVFAFTLAYYLPGLPMLLWISSLVGWVILVLESLVAAPLWVAAHALPEGDGLAGQHGRQGYFLFLNVLMRPALMVTGLLFSMVIMAGIGKLIGLSMTVLGISLAGRYTFGLISTIAMTVILCSLILIVAHKIYGLIPHFPSTIMRWVGQQRHDLGEGQDVDRVQRSFDHVGDRSERSIERNLGAGFDRGKDEKQAQVDKSARQKELGAF